MFKYKVRTNDGRVRLETNNKEAAERYARNNNGYVKTNRDRYNPFKEEGKTGDWNKAYKKGE